MTCGRHTLFLQELATGNTYAKPYNCGQFLCENCGEKQKAILYQKMLYATEKWGLSQFFTLTTKADYQEIKAVFSDLVEQIKQLDPEEYAHIYKRKKRKATAETIEKGYKEFLQKVINYEIFFNFYLMNVQDIALIIARRLGIYLAEANRGEFYAQHEQEIKAETEKRLEACKVAEPEKYAEIAGRCRELVELAQGRKFSFVRVLELQKNGNPHFHILTNFYFPHFLVQRVLKDKTRIYKNEDLRQLEGEVQGRAIVSYVLKYLTKETHLIMAEVKAKEKTRGRLEWLTGSHHIDLALVEKEEEKKFKIVRVAYRSPKANWERVEDVQEYEDELEREQSYNSFIFNIYRKHKENQLLISEYRRKSPSMVEIREFKRQLTEEFKKYSQRQMTAGLYFEVWKREGVPSVKIPLKAGADFSGLSSEQADFIKSVATKNKNFFFLLGGAGTGKTTTLNRLLKALDLSGIEVALTSYTGKATAILRAVCGQEAKTIHRLCSSRYSAISGNFLRNAGNLLSADLIICDEVSLVDKITATAFLNSIKRDAKIIFVGDEHQLNPVTTNNLIFEFQQKAFKNVYFTRLSYNFRSGDAVQDLTASIKRGELDGVNFCPYDPEIVALKATQGYQVLANSNRAVREINERAQTGKSDIVGTSYYCYNIGDKVLMYANDAVNNIFNGDICIIVGKTDCGVALQAPDGRIFTYPYYKSASAFAPATALTVHKAQGSEYDRVVVVLDDRELLLTKNLLYTAVSRARHKVEIYVKSGVDIEKLKQDQVNNDFYNLGNVSNEFLKVCPLYFIFDSQIYLKNGMVGRFLEAA